MPKILDSSAVELQTISISLQSVVNRLLWMCHAYEHQGVEGNKKYCDSIPWQELEVSVTGLEQFSE